LDNIQEDVVRFKVLEARGVFIIVDSEHEDQHIVAYPKRMTADKFCKALNKNPEASVPSPEADAEHNARMKAEEAL
jgi:hypothetical protein